ncbi:hypothetical protein SK128_014202 [Halocaridina rubra]|uniref:Major facilitator superfamily associated domain-containing protein n=1 Tax=Halocaridina rubra TaxID=373956 RepID=A0AAN9A7C7_HALRR
MVNLRINRKLVPLKAHYFLFFGSMAPVLPFIIVVAIQLGIPVPLQGSLSAFALLFTIAGKPLVSALADMFPSYRKVLFLSTISVMVAAFSSISFIPSTQDAVEIDGMLVRAILFSQQQLNSFKSFDNITTLTPLDGNALRYFSIKETVAAAHNQNSFKTGSHDLPLLVTSDKRGSGIDLGWKCNMICRSHGICDYQNNTKDLKDFILKPISDPHELQEELFNSKLLTNISISSGRDIFSSGKIVSNRNHTKTDSDGDQHYQLKADEIAWKILDANVSVECSSVKWRGENRGSITVWKTWQFWVFALLLVVGQMAFNTAVSITDAIAVDTVDEGAYGVQRAWGTIGWGVLAPISGLLVDWWSGSSLIKDYSPAFLLCFVIGIFDIILSYVSLKVPRLTDESNVFQNLRPLLRDPRFFVFLCFVILNGCLDGLVVNYIYVMQEDLAKGTSAMNNIKFIQGLTALMECGTEAPFMFVYGWFLKKLGAQKVTSLVFFLYIFRLLGLYCTGHYGPVWTTLLPEVLNGPCYGLGYTANVVYASKITPEGTSNTVQSVVNICYESFGYALAMFVGGIVYGQVGGPKMYLMACGVAAAIFILHIISLKLLPPPRESTIEAKHIDGANGSNNDQEESKALRSEKNSTVQI